MQIRVVAIPTVTQTSLKAADTCDIDCSVRASEQGTSARQMIRCLHITAAGLLVAMLTIAPWCWCFAQENRPLRISPLTWQPVKQTPAPRFKDRAPLPPGNTVRWDTADTVQDVADEPRQDRFEPSDNTTLQSELFPIEPESAPVVQAEIVTDLPALIEIAHASSPALQKLAASVEQAEGQQFQATRRPNPTIGYQGQEVGNDGALGQHGVFWSQKWIRGNKLELAGEVAGWEAKRRDWQFQVERYRIASLVRQRYYNLLATRRVREISKLIFDIAGRNLDAVAELFEAGEISRNEVLQAKIELQQSELRLDNAITAQARIERLLALAVSTPDMDCSAIQGDILATVPRLSVEKVRSWLDAESPELEAARAEIERTKWKVQREVAEPIPDVNTQVGLMYDDATNHTIGNFQVSWQIPKNDANTGNIQAAKADSRRARFALEELLLNLRDRIQKAFQQYDVAQQRVAAYESRVLPLAKDNLKITQESYKIGEATYQTLLTAQRSYFDTALALVEARRQLWLSVARIQGLVIPE